MDARNERGSFFIVRRKPFQILVEELREKLMIYLNNRKQVTKKILPNIHIVSVRKP